MGVISHLLPGQIMLLMSVGQFQALHPQHSTGMLEVVGIIPWLWVEDRLSFYLLNALEHPLN